MNSDQPQNPNEPPAFSQEIQHSQVSARVPEKVGRGVFSTGAMVFQGPHEFVIDFVLRMAQPHQIAARVVLPISIMPSMIGALHQYANSAHIHYGEVGLIFSAMTRSSFASEV